MNKEELELEVEELQADKDSLVRLVEQLLVEHPNPEPEEKVSWSELAENYGSIVEGTVNGPRQEQYGEPGKVLSIVAHLWTPLLGVQLNAQTVALALLLLKVGRLMGGAGSPDTVLDIGGYALLLAKVQALAEQEQRGKYENDPSAGV